MTGVGSSPGQENFCEKSSMQHNKLIEVFVATGNKHLDQTHPSPESSPRSPKLVPSSLKFAPSSPKLAPSSLKSAPWPPGMLKPPGMLL